MDIHPLRSSLPSKVPYSNIFKWVLLEASSSGLISTPRGPLRISFPFYSVVCHMSEGSCSSKMDARDLSGICLWDRPLKDGGRGFSEPFKFPLDPAQGSAPSALRPAGSVPDAWNRSTRSGVTRTKLCAFGTMGSFVPHWGR